MPSETDLLRHLDDDPGAPSTVSIERAIAAGRRRQRRRRATGYAGAAVLTAAAVAGGVALAGGPARHPEVTAATPKPSPSRTTAAPKPAYQIPGTTGFAAPAAKPPTSCAIERLPVPGNVSMALISGADPTGQYLVGRSYPHGGYQAVIWHNGQGRNVMLPGDLEEGLSDVNSAGEAVGFSYLDDGNGEAVSLPYAYRNGKVIKLKGVEQGHANAINDAGAIVGDDDGRRAAVVWPSATAAPVRLPAPRGTAEATASDIDEDGTTVGNLDLKVPYVWFPDGTHHALPLPSRNGAKAVSARVFSIRNGIAVGVADRTDQSRAGGGKADDMWVVRWNVRTGESAIVTDVAPPPNGSNAQGWLVGTDPEGRAVLSTGGRTVVLPELVQRKPDGLSTIPNQVSDDGKLIAGQSDDAGGTIHAVVWHCQ